jgi:hypothetical protein
MTWAVATYALWCAAALAALFLWLASVRGRGLGHIRVGRPSALLGRMLGDRTWLRVVLVLAWVWLGVHAFAR